MMVSPVDGASPQRDGAASKTGAALTRPGCRRTARGMLALQLRGDLWAMHAEQRGSIGQAYSEAVTVTDDAPISPSADAVLISTDSKEAGLWLWQGEAPPPTPPLPPRPKSRDRQMLRRIR